MPEVFCEKCGRAIDTDALAVYAGRQVTTENEDKEPIMVDGDFAYFHEACWDRDDTPQGWREEGRGTLGSLVGSSA